PARPSRHLGLAAAGRLVGAGVLATGPAKRLGRLEDPRGVGGRLRDPRVESAAPEQMQVMAEIAEPARSGATERTWLKIKSTHPVTRRAERLRARPPGPRSRGQVHHAFPFVESS